jgi:hypothetical protein
MSKVFPNNKKRAWQAEQHHAHHLSLSQVAPLPCHDMSLLPELTRKEKQEKQLTPLSPLRSR